MITTVLMIALKTSGFFVGSWIDAVAFTFIAEMSRWVFAKDA
jgi:hypothetical protein